MTCSCSSVGRAGAWQCPFPNWLPSIRTNPLPKQSVIGITGSLGATSSKSRGPAPLVLSFAGSIELNRAMASRKKPQPTWTDVKTKLASFDRKGLLALIQDLYAAHKDNRAFFHARFGLGEDALSPYKKTIARWLWPDCFRNQDPSVIKAKKAISDYKRAIADDAGLAELMVFYCERAAGFSSDVVYQDESYFNALVQTFDQAVATVNRLPLVNRDALIVRLDRVRIIGHELGYGVGDDMDFIFAKYTKRTV